MEIEENDIINLYVKEKWTLRRIAKEYKTNHHYIKRILLRNNVEIIQKGRKREPFSDEHKRKMSISQKGKRGVWKGKNMPKNAVYLNMLNHIKYNVSLGWLKNFDIEKLKILNKCIRSRDVNFDTDDYMEYIDFFYYDYNFNKIYNKWKESDYDIFKKPSLDHILPKKRGGSDSLDNLQFLTWFENKCKGNLTMNEWNKMKNNINEYFIN